VTRSLFSSVHKRWLRRRSNLLLSGASKAHSMQACDKHKSASIDKICELPVPSAIAGWSSLLGQYTCCCVRAAMMTRLVAARTWRGQVECANGAGHLLHLCPGAHKATNSTTADNVGIARRTGSYQLGSY
jgi:hypothetical protein